MKKFIIIFLSVIFISLVFYFYIYNTKTKQVTNEKSIEEITKDLKQELISYKNNLEQKILFYKNDANAGKILERLYLGKGKFCRQDEKYNEACEYFKKTLRLAQKSGNKDNEALAAWNLVWIAALQDKTDLVLSLNSKFENIIKPRFCGVFMPSYFYYYWVGQAYLNKNNLEKAAKYLDSGLKAIDSKSSRLIKHHALLICASSILASKKHNLQKALKYLKKVADSFYSFNSKYEKKQTKCFYEALAVFERCNPPNSLELSALYEEIASVYAYDNKVKFKEYIFKAIRVLKDANTSNEKIAALYFKIGRLNYEPNNKYFEKCIKLLKGIKNKDAAKIIFKIALHSYDENSEESLRLLLLSLKMLPELNKKTLWIARAYHLIAFYYNKRKEWQKSAEYAQKCLELIKQNDKIEIRFAIALGCYSFLDDLYKNQENLKKRIKNDEDAVAFMKNKKCDLLLLNSAYKELGEIYKLDKRYSDSEKSYKEIIKIINKNPKLRENTEYLKQEIDAYCEIGDLHLEQKDKTKALEAFDKASKLIKRKTIPEFSQWYIAKVFRNIADGYYYLHKDDLAEKYYKKLLALLLAKNTKDHRAIAYVCHRIGNIAFGQKKLQKSQDYFKKGLKFALTAYEKQRSKYGNNLKTGLYAAGVGAFYDQLGQKNKAIKYLKIAHQLLKKYGENQPVLAEKVVLHIKKIKK